MGGRHVRQLCHGLAGADFGHGGLGAGGAAGVHGLHSVDAVDMPQMRECATEVTRANQIQGGGGVLCHGMSMVVDRGSVATRCELP